MKEPAHCKETLLQAKTQVSAGTDATLYIIKVKNSGSAIDLVAEKNQLKSKYGIQGLVEFQLKCDETGGANACKKCPGPFPCPPVKRSLSLISQSIVNGAPRFNPILRAPLIVTHTGPNDNDFECNSSSPSPGLDLSNVMCAQGEALQGFDTTGNKICIAGGTDINNISCPVDQYLRGFDSSGDIICTPVSGTACTGGSIWSSSASKCVCPTGQHFENEQCRCNGDVAFWDTSLNRCVCPSGKGFVGYQRRNIYMYQEGCKCSTSRPHWTGTMCIPCTGGKVKEITGRFNRCDCPSTWPFWNPNSKSCTNYCSGLHDSYKICKCNYNKKAAYNRPNGEWECVTTCPSGTTEGTGIDSGLCR
ncbi:MAG: hypothetical protein OXJ52_04765 [Oligoflexia bacterium]|nr:hypothetical protein [Oligoflexia bacterium]